MTRREERQRQKRALRQARERRSLRRRRGLRLLSHLCFLTGGAALVAVAVLSGGRQIAALLGCFWLWSAAAWSVWGADPRGTSAFWGRLGPVGPLFVRTHGNLAVALLSTGVSLGMTLLVAVPTLLP